MKAKHFLPCLLCFLLAACGGRGLSFTPKIDVDVVNRSFGALDNAEAYFGDYRCRWGRVGKTYTAAYMYFPHPITPKAELHWDEAGKHRVEHLDLSRIYPAGASGRLTFTVYDGRVEVTFQPQS